MINSMNTLLGALNSYERAFKILKDSCLDIRPEISNNLAALHHRLGHLEEAIKYYTLALQRCDDEINHSEENHFSLIAVTITYNLARLYEDKLEFHRAEQLYKAILEEYPDYVDCYLRLGYMARDLGKTHEASDWFQRSSSGIDATLIFQYKFFALKFNNKHTDAWTSIANLHLDKFECLPARRKFERILAQQDTANDAYSMVGIGNVWLHLSQQDKGTQAQNLDRALSMYEKALSIDNKNIWAVNGIGAVLAYKGLSLTSY